MSRPWAAAAARRRPDGVSRARRPAPGWAFTRQRTAALALEAERLDAGVFAWAQAVAEARPAAGPARRGAISAAASAAARRTVVRLIGRRRPGRRWRPGGPSRRAGCRARCRL